MLQNLINIGTKFATKVFSSGVEKTVTAGCVPLIKMSENNKLVKRPRYDGRTKKRQWEERRSDHGEGLNPKQPKIEPQEKGETELTDSGDKIKRRKFVLLMGYSGADYYGMQRNPLTKTIEEELFKALFDAKFINKECYDQVQNMQFQRAARTDKGVSAARQVVSMKLGENLEIEKINERLPEVIRVFASKRVTKGFNSKSQCDGRTYIYIVPTVAFADHDAEVDQKSFRLSDEKFVKINEVLKEYEGTKNFHNFTSKKKPNDPSAKRFMRSFVCEKPFVRDGVEFAVLKVYGQSFMLHQIRKMVGLLLAVVRGLATTDTIKNAFSSEKVNIPRAPGLGLVLDYVHYERYNFRYGQDGMHETLTWDEVEEQVQEFKEKHIYPTIINTEIKEEPMVYWLKNKLSRHNYLEAEEDEDDDEKNGESDEESDNKKNDVEKVKNE